MGGAMREAPFTWSLGGGTLPPGGVVIRVFDMDSRAPCGCFLGKFAAAADPRTVNPAPEVGVDVALRWAADLRRAVAGEPVTGEYGHGIGLCGEHSLKGPQPDDMEERIRRYYSPVPWRGC